MDEQRGRGRVAMNSAEQVDHCRLAGRQFEQIDQVVHEEHCQRGRVVQLVRVGDGVAVGGGGERVEEAGGERRVGEVGVGENEAAGGSEKALGVVALVVEGRVERVAGSGAGGVGGSVDVDEE